jgi:hypothetical protein
VFLVTFILSLEVLELRGKCTSPFGSELRCLSW